MKSGLFRLLEIAGEKRFPLVVSGIFSALGALCMLLPYFASYLILKEFLTHYNQLHLINQNLVFDYAILAIEGILGGLICIAVAFIISHLCAYRILYNIRMRLLRHLALLPLGYFTQTTSGEINRNLHDNVERIELFIAHMIPDFINSLASATILFVFMFSFDWRLALMCLVVFLLGLFWQFRLYFHKDFKDKIAQYYSSLEKMNTHSIEYVKGLPLIKIFGRSVFSFKKFFHEVEAYKNFSLEWTILFKNSFVIFKVLITSFLAFILPLGALILSFEPDNIAFVLVFLFFIMTASGLTSPLFKLMFFASELTRINEGVKRIDCIFSQKPLQEPINPKVPTNFEVAFEDVNFAYGEQNILQGISFALPQNQKLAIIGESGGGKSTILSLLCRFYEPNAGVIKIGGINIQDIPTSVLFDKISFVFQENILFSESIFENIRMSNKTASLEEVKKAAQLALCDEFIDKLPLKYDTLIGEKGVHLSGGEAQRITIARAILKDSPILLLDEMTAFIDNENDKKIQIALHHLCEQKNKTILLVTHKLHTAKDADTIILLEKGQIKAIGKHEELLKHSQAYKQLWGFYENTQQWTLKKDRA